MREPHVFAGSPLDRAEPRRRDAEWLALRLEDPTTRFLPVWRLNPLVRSGDTPGLAWATAAVRDSIDEDSEPVFLGIDGEVAHFAVNVSELEDPEQALGVAGAAGFPDLRATAAQLPAGEASIAAQARHLLDWHRRHRFCPGCGARTQPKDAGYARLCTSPGCATEHFPRTDPVVIMLVTDGERCLLGRQGSWPRPFFSALAGFVEPGEALEEAVRREVDEETGIRVGRVRYRSSQPWPFPASLMLGCVAEAQSSEIHIDPHELEEAAWFSREQVAAALAGPTEALAVPPPVAIAHQLIRAWAEGD